MRGRWASAALGAGMARRQACYEMEQQAQAYEAQQQQAQQQIEAQQRQIEALQRQKQQQPQPHQEDLTQNTISDKIFDFSRGTIEGLLEDGYDDAKIELENRFRAELEKIR